MFWALRVTPGSAECDPALRGDGERSWCGEVQARGGGIDTRDVAVPVPCPVFIVVDDDLWAGGDVGGGVDDWARQIDGPTQERRAVASKSVQLPIRPIKPGSLPIPPDRKLRRSDSRLAGHHMLLSAGSEAHIDDECRDCVALF
jgi:hypothetical protein